MRKLFLDDTRNPPDSSWDVVRSYAEFVAYIEKHGVPDIISFDHDLAREHYPDTNAFVERQKEVHCLECNGNVWEQKMGGMLCQGCRHFFDWYEFSRFLNIPYETYTEKTGYDCVKWLIEKELPIRGFLVHSMNPVGAENIRALLENWKRACGRRNEDQRDAREND